MFGDEKEKYNLKFLDNTIHRISLIYYDNLIDENNLNIGYGDCVVLLLLLRMYIILN